MKTINVEIKGVTPLLMNSPASMLENEKPTKLSTEKYDPKREAEIRAYKLKNGNLYIPGTAIMGSLIGAASWKKAGKHALKPIIAASVRITPELIDLGTKNYELDVRTVVIQKKSRIVRVRPKVEDWKATFQITYNESLITPGVIRECLAEAGERVGLLDFRPQKLGPFGTFEVSKWKEVAK